MSFIVAPKFTFYGGAQRAHDLFERQGRCALTAETSPTIGRKRTSLERWFDGGVGRLHCLPWDADAGLKWAELLAHLRRTGKAMPIKDSLIAATAVQFGLRLGW